MSSKGDLLFSGSYVVPGKEKERISNRRNGDMPSDNGMFNGSREIVLGPECDVLYPYLLEDEWIYAPESPLSSLESREMVASTVISLLPFAHEFTTIVGEDRGGRIPSLIAAKSINIVRQRLGLEGARRVFVSGGIRNNVIPAFNSDSPEDRALVVTEYISSGGSVNSVLSALGRVGFSGMSVATIDRGGMYLDIDADQMFMGNHNSYTTASTTHFYQIPKKFMGVDKKYGPAHAERVDFNSEERKGLLSVREDMSHFGQEIVNIWDRLNIAPEDQIDAIKFKYSNIVQYLKSIIS